MSSLLNGRNRVPTVEKLESNGVTSTLISRLSLTDPTIKVEGDDPVGHFDGNSGDIQGHILIDYRQMLNQPFSRKIEFTKPIRKGYYSVAFDYSRNMEFIQDASALRYLCCPRNGLVNMDLLLGFNRFNRRHQDNRNSCGRQSDSYQIPSRSMHFFKWLFAHKTDLLADQLEIGEETGPIKDTFADFVCGSFILKSIMATPYISSESSWSIIAIKLNGVIYLFESKPNRPVNENREQITNDRSRSFTFNPVFNLAACYAGIKFKEMISTRHNGSHSATNDKGNRDSFWTVCATNVGLNHRVLYNVKTECALDDHQLSKSIDEAAFVELRTRPSNINEHRWENRAIDWWLTALLAGIEVIFCGERDRDYNVRKVTKLFADSLPKNWYKWSPKTCVDFLNDILTFISNSIHDEMTPYHFGTSDDVVICTQLDEPVDNFIPNWYIHHAMNEVDDLKPRNQEETTQSIIKIDPETKTRSDTECLSDLKPSKTLNNLNE